MHKYSVLSRFGDAVKQMRNRLGITQEELAGRAGLHRTYVADIERGARNVSLESIEKLARALETSLPGLFAQTKPEPNGSGKGRMTEADREFVDILLVEDDPHDVDLTLRAFKRARFTNPIRLIRDGAAALNYLFGDAEDGGRPAHHMPGVILLDLNLPKIGGMEVLRRIKGDERTRKIPVVILTVSQRSRDIIECQSLGAETYLVKPVGFQNFSQITPKLSLHWALLKPTS